MAKKTAAKRNVKGTVKDALSRSRQLMGLPHDRTRAQVREIKAAFDPTEIEKQRIALISQATGLAQSTVEGFIAELNQPEWDEMYRSQKWSERGGSMMSRRDGVTLYALVRALNPKVCVETGVAGGASSTYTLSVLERNGEGRLYAIDVQGPNAKYYGELIPEHLRKRWELRIQQDTIVLPVLLEELREIDFFLHDSQHKVGHMTWEYELAWRYLKPGGCLASHDVVTTTAFEDFKRRHDSEIAGGGRIGNFGFWIKHT